MSCSGENKQKFSFACPCDVSNPRKIDFRFPESCGDDIPEQLFFDGDISFAILEKHDEFTLQDIHHGETLEISTFIAQPEDIVSIDDGEDVELFLYTESVVPSENWSGEDVEFELQTFPTIIMPLRQMGDGEDVGNVNPYWYQSYAHLELVLTPGFLPNFYDGENIQFTLDYPKAIPLALNSHDGDYASNTLHTIQRLTEELNVHDGEQSSISSMLFAKFASIDASISDGEYSSLAINLVKDQNTFSLTIHDGEQSESELLKSRPNPLKNVTFAATDGDNTEHVFRTESILVFDDYDGSEAIIDQPIVFDYSQFERFYDGEMIPTYSLRASSLFHPREMADGDHAWIAFKARPPEKLFPNVLADGDNVWFTIDRLKTVTCRPYNIIDGDWVSCELENVSRNFSLCKACAPIIACDAIIEFERQPILWEWSSDLKEKVEVALSVEKRFEFNFNDGESSVSRLFERNNPIGPFLFTDGETQRNELWWDKSLVFDNTSSIINGGKADIDLGQGDTDRQFSRWCMDGENVSVVLETIQSCYFKISDGEGITYNLDIWKWPGFYDGEFVHNGLATDVKLYVNIFDGEVTPSKFPEPDWDCVDGERVTMELKIVYDVYFKEYGCVDNEYIPRDVNGEPQWHLRTTAAIEFDPFEYSLKGGCY